MKFCLCLILILGLPLLAQAQTISGYTGEFAHEGSLTILGSGFGSKNHDSPVTWDDMENGSFDPLWQNTNGLNIGNESRHANSSYCGTANMAGTGGGNTKHAYFTGDNGTLGQNWFCQYWFKLDPNFDWGYGSYGELGANLANVKIFRLWNPGSNIENFVMATRTYAGSSVAYKTENVSNPQGGYFSDVESWTKNVWHCMQFEYQEGSIGANDGIIRVWIDGEQVLNNTGMMTREDEPELKRPLILGFYNSWGDAGTDRDDIYIDDAYIDNSWARVEVGNNASYNSCTHREIQPPVDWNSGSITVDVNTGSFNPGDNLYLFVVNAQGDVSSGFALEGGVGGDETPPETRDFEIYFDTASGDLTLTCTTNETATTVLNIGLDLGYGSNINGSSDDGLTHRFILTGLSHDLVYHYRVQATDGAGNTGTSVDRDFWNFNSGEPTRAGGE